VIESYTPLLEHTPLLEGYTPLLAGYKPFVEGYASFLEMKAEKYKIITECTVDDFTYLDNIDELNVKFVVSYKSRYIDVSEYENLLKDYIEKNPDKLRDDLKGVGIDINYSVFIYILEQTDPPTIGPTSKPSSLPSSNPSDNPTNIPSVPPSLSPSFLPSQNPSDIPSFVPSLSPTNMPSMMPSSLPSVEPSQIPSSLPSIKPSQIPSSLPSQIPSRIPSVSPSSSPTIRVVSSTAIYVSVSAAIGGMAVILAMGLCWKRRNKLRGDGEEPGIVIGPVGYPDMASRTNGIGGGGLRAPSIYRHNNDNRGQFQTISNSAISGRIDDQGIPVLPDDESIVSHGSIISTGSSVGDGSGDEYDDTQILADEFEKYKDQNLEKMRSKLEGNVSNFDGMMSQALTMALMDDDDDISEAGSMMVGDRDSIAIEADLLCEMYDWLKRTGEASVDER
jgi:hypothetical protein